MVVYESQSAAKRPTKPIWKRLDAGLQPLCQHEAKGNLMIEPLTGSSTQNFHTALQKQTNHIAMKAS